MPSALMYQSDGFVVLEPNQPEQFLTPEELLDKLKTCLRHLPGELPRDLQKFTTLEAQAKHLMETACELDLGPGTFLQWYAVRLEKS